MAYGHRVLDLSFPTGSTIAIVHRCVRLTTAGVVVHTTAASTAGNVRFLGVLEDAPTASTSSPGYAAPVRVEGVVKVEASSAAITPGFWLRLTSGAAASTSRLGGTVRSTTTHENAIGMSLDGVAAGTGRRLVSMLIRSA